MNGMLSYFHITLQQIFGYVFSPIAWLLGVKFNDCQTIGNLLGTRLVLNEFIAFQQLGPLQPHLDPRSFTIATYALVRFREFQLHRDSDWRHRSAGALAQIGSGAAGVESSGRWDHGEFHVGMHRRNFAVMRW